MEDKINSIKKNIKDKRKLFFIVAFIVVVVVLILVFGLSKEGKFIWSLDPIYDVYPDEVKELYSNIVEVSCSGDLHLDISLDTGIIDIKDMKQKDLLNYLFSYLAKNDKLSDEIPIDLFIESSDKLFAAKLDLTKDVNNYRYGDYIYNLKNGIITRVLNKDGCSNDFKYISNLYAYSFNDELLSMDVNIGYLKDDILYNLTNDKLGKYNGNLNTINDLFHGSSYYRYNYVKDGNDFKLKSVEWNVRY